ADQVRHRCELLARELARRGIHPSDSFELARKGGGDLFHHRFRGRFAVARETLLNERLSEQLTERVIGRLDAAFPARAQLFLAGERLLHAKALVDEGLGQRRRGRADDVPHEIALPLRGFDRPEQVVHALEELHAGDVDVLDLRMPEALEVAFPVEPRSRSLDAIAVDLVVEALGIAALDSSLGYLGEL